MQTLIADASTHKLFESKDARIATMARQLWDHSVAVALVARDLAAILGGCDPEGTYVAGLVHDVGKLIAAGLLLEVERAKGEPILAPEAWLEVVGAVCRPVGVALAETWRLPEAVTDAIRDSGEFDSANRASAANVVCFANTLTKLEGVYPGTFARDEAEALLMIGRSLLGFDEDVVKRLATGIKSRVAAEMS